MPGVQIMDESSIDFGVPWHYGDPLREQRSFASGAGRVDLSHYEVVAVHGQDRVSWLHTLTTQEITEATLSCQTLVLSPHGHVEHDLHLINHDDTVYLIVEPGTTTDLIGYLESMRFLLRVEVTDVTAQWAVVGAPGWLTIDAPTWHSPAAYLGDGPVDYVPDRPHPWQVSQFLVRRDELGRHLTDDPVGTWAWEAHRIRAGVPRLRIDTDHRTIPHEVGWVAAAVHLNKGCYRGQETVARVYNLGKPPRRLVQLELDGSTNELPKHGDPVLHETAEVGRVTSVTQDFEHGPLALALIKRSVPIDALLHAGEVSASQTAIVR
jgi:folate-binding protein YgfZ